MSSRPTYELCEIAASFSHRLQAAGKPGTPSKGACQDCAREQCEGTNVDPCSVLPAATTDVDWSKHE